MKIFPIQITDRLVLWSFAVIAMLACQSVKATGAATSEILARVVGIHDGDTITVLDGGNQQIKIRLNGIDSPELGRDFGEDARQTLSDLVFGKTVRISVFNLDRYGRTIGTVWLEDTDVNLKMIKLGMAWAYRKYLRNPADIEAEITARNARIGLWSQPVDIPHWESKGTRQQVGKLHTNSPLQSPKHAVTQKRDKSNDCGSKRFCKQMSSCEEALYFLKTCGVRELDGDGDGIACETLCQPAQPRLLTSGHISATPTTSR